MSLCWECGQAEAEAGDVHCPSCKATPAPPLKVVDATRTEGLEPAGGLPDVEGLPQLKANEGNLAIATEAAWGVLCDANEPVEFFTHGRAPARIEVDRKDGPLIRHLSQDRMRHHLARVAHWVSISKEGAKDAHPPMAVVRDMLASPEVPLPPLKRIVEAPVFAPDGSLEAAPGYSPAAQTYYMPAAGFEVPDVSPTPTADERDVAAKLIVQDILGDFPFTSEAERAHAVALVLLPFARGLIDGPTPLHLIEKPHPGTGATLLADMLLFPATGSHVATFTEGRDEDEWRKRITAKLRGGPAVMLIDNLRRRLDSAAVSASLTAPFWEDRILGHSEMTRIPVECAWVATGNNPALSVEVARRTVRIRMDAKTDKPWLRDTGGLRHPDLRGWVRDHRGALCWAALTLIQAWIAQGRPAGDHLSLGMFERWSEVIGGILEMAGIKGFLGNLDELYEESDEEGRSWRGFIADWYELHADTPMKTAQLFELAAAHLDLGQGQERSQKTRLGAMLSAARDRRFGDLRLVREGQEHRVSVWRLRAEEGVPRG